MMIVIELASLTPVNTNNSVIDVNIRQVGDRFLVQSITFLIPLKLVVSVHNS
jgi:hypothetical protein